MRRTTIGRTSNCGSSLSQYRFVRGILQLPAHTYIVYSRSYHDKSNYASNYCTISRLSTKIRLAVCFSSSAKLRSSPTWIQDICRSLAPARAVDRGRSYCWYHTPASCFLYSLIGPENQKKEETRHISKFLLQTDYTERRT